MADSAVPEMVARVAKAICCLGDSCCANGGFVCHYEDQARAAIAAMREPTEAMVAVGLNERDVSGMGSRGLPRCFTRMIDAALTPEGTGRTGDA